MSQNQHPQVIHGSLVSAEYTFSVESGMLVPIHRKIERKILESTYRDGFAFEGYDLRFSRRPDGEVEGFTISSGRVRRVSFTRVK